MSLFAQRAAQLARSALTKSALKGPVAKKALNAVAEVTTEVAKSVEWTVRLRPSSKVVKGR